MLAAYYTISPYTVSYDVENRQSGFTSTSNGSATYTYDGDGRRVEKTAGGVTTTYVYDAMGNLAAEYSSQPPSMPCQTCYLTTDHLGSTRAITSQTGGLVSRHDFLPFGEELATINRTAAQGYGVADNVLQRFTGQQRDLEGPVLDFFGARYFSAPQGRFTSPDWSEIPQSVPYADLTDPQTLNLYAYVRNNPLSHRDIDGHFWEELKNFWQWGHWVNNANLNAALQQDADAARKRLSGMHDFSINGQTPQAIAKSGSNQQVIVADRAATNFIINQGMSLCAPAVSCGVILPPLEGPLGVAGEAAEGLGNVASGAVTAEEALTQAEKYLGPGYKEIAPGVYRSADNARQFRMTTSDPTDVKQGIHVHFESVGPDGRTITENSHVGITNP